MKHYQKDLNYLWKQFAYERKSEKNPLHKKRSFPLRISLVNVSKSAGNCGFAHIYWRNP